MIVEIIIILLMYASDLQLWYGSLTYTDKYITILHKHRYITIPYIHICINILYRQIYYHPLQTDILPPFTNRYITILYIHRYTLPSFTYTYTLLQGVSEKTHHSDFNYFCFGIPLYNKTQTCKQDYASAFDK